MVAAETGALMIVGGELAVAVKSSENLVVNPASEMKAMDLPVEKLRPNPLKFFPNLRKSTPWL